MSLIDRITFEPEKCGGKPCMRGIRIRVTDVLGLLSRGLTHDQVLKELPDLEEADILASLEYSTQRLDHPRFKVTV